MTMIMIIMFMTMTTKRKNRKITFEYLLQRSV